MELASEQPPAYVSHNPDDLKLPSVPQQDLAHSHAPSEVTLPDLKSVLGDLPTKTTLSDRTPSITAYQYTPPIQQNSRNPRRDTARTLPKLDASPRTIGNPTLSMDSTIRSPSDTASIMSFEGQPRRSTSVVSLEDPDVRLAAEALSGLGNPDYIRSPTYAHSSISSQASPLHTEGKSQEPEPLLNLLVDAHPWVGGTINSSLSAYTTTKHYSPRFVQYGANLIERSIGSPVASTVTSVGRRTGVEGGLRRYLGGRRPSDVERADDDGKWSKRRRVTADEDSMDVDGGSSELALAEDSDRRTSQESLPAYRSSKPPSYREELSPVSTDRQRFRSRPQHNRSWSTKLMISTSGLGVALSESSLRSLTYCVSLLTKATEHVEMVTDALKMVLREYDDAQASRKEDALRRAKEVEAGLVSRSEAEREQAANKLAERIKQLCDDIWNTMKTVVGNVSTYAGGALPDNARRLVKGQLLSIPQRWRSATEIAAHQNQQRVVVANGDERGTAGTEHEVRGAAHRMIAFADEGLDMMAQVNGVVKITLQSAEDWLRTMGRRGREEEMMDADDTVEASQ